MKSVNLELFKEMLNDDFSHLTNYYNLTITFNPSKYNVIETYHIDTLNEIIQDIKPYSRSFFLVKENHKNAPFACHYHGIIKLDEGIKPMKTLQKILSKNYGITTLRANISTSNMEQMLSRLNKVTELRYSNYLDYCLKEIDQNVSEWSNIQAVGALIRPHDLSTCIHTFRVDTINN